MPVKFDLSTASFETDLYEGEFDEEGIEIAGSCDCGNLVFIYLKIEEWEEIVERAKEFRDRKTR